MAITVSIDVHEAVFRAAREKEKSYDEAVKEFLEVYQPQKRSFQQGCVKHAYKKYSL